VFGFELEVAGSAPPHARFTERPATPASERDLTLLVPDDVPAATLLGALSGAGVSVLESVRIVNEFRGARIPSGTRSLTLRATFRAPERTLETADVDRAEAELLGVLERQTGVRRRDQGDPARE
jgi:phenylalanyl-tRNA synthetase beta chain